MYFNSINMHFISIKRIISTHFNSIKRIFMYFMLGFFLTHSNFLRDCLKFSKISEETALKFRNFLTRVIPWWHTDILIY